MFCPQCKSEYRPGFTRCADCGVALVDSLPQEPHQSHAAHDDKGRLVPVLETRDRADVVTIRMVLDQEGIEYYLQGEILSTIRMDDPIILMVRQNDAVRVRELLNGVKLNYSSSAFNPKKKR